MKLFHYISEYLGVLVLAAALLALAFPSVLQQVPTTVINPLLGVIMFGMGLTLNLKDFTTIPGAIFSVWHNISGAIVAWLSRRQSRHQPCRAALRPDGPNKV